MYGHRIRGGLTASDPGRTPSPGSRLLTRPALSGAAGRHADVTTDLVDQLRSDVTALQYFDSLGLELPADFLMPLAPRLVQPSLVVLGYGQGVDPWAATRVVHRLAHEGLRQGLKVTVTSSRDWTQELRAACLVGMSTARRLAGQRPRPDDPELDAKKYLGDLAESKARLKVLGVEDISNGERPQGPMDMWLIDDVPGLSRLLSGSSVGARLETLDASPAGLRQASRLAMCTIFVTVDWRLTERWRWVREADAVVDIETDSGLPVLRSGDVVERLPL